MPLKRAESAALPNVAASWSIAARLLLLFGGSFLAILVGVVLFLYLDLERDLYRDEQTTLEDQIEAIRAVLPIDPNLSGPPSEDVRSLSVPSQSHYGLRVTDEGGRVVFETPGLSKRVPSDLFRASA